MSDGIDPIGMAATGIGLGIMTMGALVPLVIMKKVLDNDGKAIGKTGRGIKVTVPKMNVNFKAPKLAVKKLKIK